MRRTCILIFCFASFRINSFGHDQKVHQAITKNAAESAHDDSPAFTNFIDVISSDFPYTGRQGATNFLVEGSYDEDFEINQDPIGGYRSLNHFYDPTKSPPIGLTDRGWPLSPASIGRDSFTWASISNSPAVDSSIESGKYNIWSWQNARGYEWLGLTAVNQSERQVNLAKMFQSVGQVMHLLEDTSQPQHVRNEAHLDQIPYLKIDLWSRSAIEDYYKKHQLIYQHDMLDWRGDGFTKLADFWNRDFLRTKGAAALNADLSGGANTLGLAEFTSGNFIGQRAVYAEFFSNHNDIHYFAYPSLADTTQPNLQKGNLWGTATHGDVTLENFKHGTRLYISKTNAGVSVTYHSALGYLVAEHPGKASGIPTLLINDDNVLSNYHALLIPKAVEYSAGLLDYFFRGMISADIIGYDENLRQYTNQIINVSGEDFSGGAFFVYGDDANGTRTLLGQTNLTSTLADGQSMTMAFSSPAQTTTSLLCLYRGNIGVDENGNALDPVDVNIAIAATAVEACNFNVQDLQWTNMYPAGTISGSMSGGSGNFAFDNLIGDYCSVQSLSSMLCVTQSYTLTFTTTWSLSAWIPTFGSVVYIVLLDSSGNVLSIVYPPPNGDGNTNPGSTTLSMVPGSYYLLIEPNIAYGAVGSVTLSITPLASP